MLESYAGNNPDKHGAVITTAFVKLHEVKTTLKLVGSLSKTAKEEYVHTLAIS
jgi:hypothetical protein